MVKTCRKLKTQNIGLVLGLGFTTGTAVSWGIHLFQVPFHPVHMGRAPSGAGRSLTTPRPTRRRATGRSLKLPWPARRCRASDQFHVLMGGHPFSRRRRREVRATTLLCPSPTDGSRRSGVAPCKTRTRQQGSGPRQKSVALQTGDEAQAAWLCFC